MTVKKIAVVGTGANGAAFGSDMIGAGLDVTFIEQWPAHVDAMPVSYTHLTLPTKA